MTDWEEETPTPVAIFENLKRELEQTLREMYHTKSYLKKIEIDDPITTSILKLFEEKLVEFSEDNDANRVIHSDVDVNSQKNISYKINFTKAEIKTDRSQEEATSEATEVTDLKLEAALGFVVQAKSDQDCAVQLLKLGFHGQAAHCLQQSAEKLLKSILFDQNGRYVPYWETSHNLSILAGCVRKQLKIQDFELYDLSKSLDELGEDFLNPCPLSIRARYPRSEKMEIDIKTFPCFAFTAKDVREGLLHLKQIYHFTLQYFEARIGGEDVSEYQPLPDTSSPICQVCLIGISLKYRFRKNVPFLKIENPSN
jgi:HEPN domain-containing protein